MIPSPDDTSPDRAIDAAVAEGIGGLDTGQGDTPREGPSDERLLRLIAIAESQARSFAESHLRASWTRSYRAYRNEHFDGSKYRSDRYKARSKIFRPKTRAAVRKNMATAAAALFSTQDVVSITPDRDDDPRQNASAAVLHEDLNYRLTKPGSKSGVPWFHIAMGACQDAQITGICVSKQCWDFLEVEDKTAPEPEPELREGIDEETGETVYVEMPGERPKRVVKDRPLIDLMPPENVLMDPAAGWTDPVQEGVYFIARYPMHVGDLKAMIRGGDKSGAEIWLPLDDSTIREAQGEYDAKGIRTAREGTDRIDENNVNAGDLGIVWVHENFIRVDGVDYQFWTLGTRRMLSEPRETVEAYPAQGGERPYVMGVGALEAHRAFPMSPVESWQQLQWEINDNVNLRLDSVKQTIAPIAKVKRGRNVDLDQVQRRGPDSVLMLQDLADVSIEPTGSVNPIAYQEMNALNADFDDLSGSFSGGSVQTNRQLNETVGGMHLLAGNANALTEFDLRVWVETWVERALRQTVRNIQYYESDEVLLSIVGEKAKLLTRFGIDTITDDLLMADVGVRVNVGIGAADPMQRARKFSMAMEAMSKIVLPMVGPRIKPNAEALMEEALGAAGYRDGKRFFEVMPEQPPQPPPPDPKVLADAQAKAAQIASNERIAAGQAAVDMKKAEMSRDAAVRSTIIKETGASSRQQNQYRNEALGRIADLFAGVDSAGIL